MIESMDRDWLDTWIQEWGDKLTRFAHLHTGDRDLAQDIAQEAFLRLYRYHRDNPHESLTVGWLFTVTRNLARDALRKQRRQHNRETKLESSLAGVGSSFESGVTDRLMVDKVLYTLSQKDRDCLWLFYYEDYSVKDIAERLHLTPAGVRTRLHRARHRFEAEWEGIQDE